MRRSNRRRGTDRYGQRELRPRRPWGRYQEPCVSALRPKLHLDAAMVAQADWPEFWDAAARQLRSVGLRLGTLRVYRQVLRSFRRFLCDRGADSRPDCP